MQALMTPILEWGNDSEPNPTCGGCGPGRISWTRDCETGYWVCPTCRKPSQGYLVECDICEMVWLPEVFSNRYPDPKYPRVVSHEECILNWGEYLGPSYQ